MAEQLSAITAELRARFGDRFSVLTSLRDQIDVTIAGGFDTTQQMDVLIHWVRGLAPGQLRLLEYEASELRDHPSSVLPTIVEATSEDDFLILISACESGQPLRDLIESKGALGYRQAIRVAISVFQGLGELHRLGLHHLEVRAGNILVNSDGTAKLIRTDFARPQVSEQIQLQRAAFFSPEQAGSIERDVSAPADLYSAGILLFYMLAGRLPFAASDVGGILLAHMTQPIPSLDDLGVEVPSVLQTVIDKLLRKDASDRYQTAAAVLHDLEQLEDALQAGECDPQFVVASQDRRATLTEPAFVGRDTELSQILDKTCTDSDKNALMFLEGESGLGKTRLLAEVARRAIGNGVSVFRGQCRNDTVRRSLAVFEGIADGFLNRYQVAEFATAFQQSFDGDPSDLTTNFPKLESVFGESQREASTDSFGERRSLRTLCSFVNSLGADRPAVLILDDCQWADELTLKMLARWWKLSGADARHNVTVLAVFRSDEVSDEHVLRRLEPSTHIQLSLLGNEDVRALAESMAGHLPERAIELITKVAGGSPFMASAVVRGLVESDAIERHGNSWSIDEERFAECQSSDHAAEFLARRLQLLDGKTIDLLSAGAVLGKEFDLDAAAYLARADTGDSIRRCGEARARNLVWFRGAGKRYVFSHDKIRELLLSEVTSSKRQAMHLAAAEYLRRHAKPNVGEISFHYDAAGNPKRALPYAVAAGEEALRHYSLQVAKTQYMIAERASGFATDRMKYRIQRGLGEVLMLRGEYEIVEEHVREASKYACSDLEKAQILGSLAEIRRRRSDLSGSIDCYIKALGQLGFKVPRTIFATLIRLTWEILTQVCHTYFPSLFIGRLKREPSESERLALRVFSGLSHSYYNGSNIIKCFSSHLRSLNICERFLPSPEMALLYAEHAPAISMAGLFQRASRYAERARELRRHFGDIWGEGQALHYHGVALYAAAQYEDVIVKCREALRLLERMGDYWEMHMARYQVAASLYHLGRFQEAVDEARKNHASGIETADYQASGIILDVWARADPGGVPEEILDAELNRRRDDAQASCQVGIAKSVNWTGQGRYDEAFQCAEDAIGIAFRAGVFNPYPIAAYVWGLVALRKKAESLDPFSSTERQSILRRAVWCARRALLAQTLFKVDQPRLLREYALIRIMQNRPQDARRLLKRSIQVARRQNAAFDHAESLRWLGILGIRCGWENAKQQHEEAKVLLSRHAIESGLDKEAQQTSASKETSTLSLADRFDTILDVGRRIASALTETDVYKQTRFATQRLLRCEHCAIVEIHDDGYQIVEGNSEELDTAALQRSMELGQAVSTNLESGSDTADQQQGSMLCAPIFALGRVEACLYATHLGVRDLFGPTEERLGDLIAAIAGASLENAHGYNRLQALNLTLEDRVAERTKAAEIRAQELALSNSELERTASDLRSTEEQLREAIREANAANEAKSQFLATMSHEIRTPMNGILGMTDLLMRSSLTPQQESSLRVVKQSGETLLTLLNDVLDLSKVEAGKMELEHINFELREVVENAARLLSAEAHKKQLDVICEVESNVPQYVQGDPNRLRQILSNLVGNAIKFTDQGEIHVQVSKQEAHVVVSVRDTGIGIPVNKQKTVFERFRQSDSSTTRQYGGTGLGLAISRTLVEMMGGSISLSSKPNVGSTFTVSLPFQDATGTQLDRANERFRGLVVALLSDDSVANRSYRIALECLGLNVMSYRALSELDELDTSNFDLLVIDEPLLEVWKQQAWTAPPVVALTRPTYHVDSEWIQVYKPLLLNELERAIEVAMGGHEAPPPAPLVSSGYHVLLADDSPVNQEVAARFLELAGHTVTTVNNGAEAVEYFAAGDFDLILMDLEMPEMDGFQATQEIRKLPQGADVPIVAMSAHAELDKERQCSAAGIVAYIPKPFDPDQLLECIEQLVQRTPDSATT